jgi:murein DD-endopeptidase MepM/ murein hydrolase activator NlpD
MTTKLFLVVGALQALILSEARASERSRCLELPVETRPVWVSQLFHDPRPVIVPDPARVSWPIGLAHDGLDIKLPGGTALYALAGGVVIAAGLDQDGSGGVTVQTASGRRYLLGHLYAVSVKRGDRVHRGQILGYSGGEPGVYGSGPYTTGPHLHLTVLDPFGEAVDPLPLFCRDKH